MNKSSLLEIIRTFSKEELIKFEDFVRSPYFNRKANAIKLFLAIKKYAPEFKEENLEKERVWDLLFPGKKYNYGIMKNLIFDLNKLAELYISDLKFRVDENKQNEYLLNALLHRGLNRTYNNKFKFFTVEPDLKIIEANNSDISDHINYVNRMFNMKFFYHHQYDQNYNLKDLMGSRDSFLISSFLIQLFAAYNDVDIISNYNKSDIKDNVVTKLIKLITPVMEAILESIGEKTSLNSKYVRIYYLMYLALTEKSEKHFQEFKNIVFENLDILPKSNKQSLHHCLATAILRTKFKTTERDMEMLEILDSMIKHNIITEVGNDKIPLHIFIVYISICFYFPEYEKLKSFSEKFIPKLDPEVRVNTSNYVNFMLHFLNRSYNEALKSISLLDIPFILLKPGIRIQKAMCLYETDNYEIFLNETDNLKHFLSNNKFVADKERDSLNSNFAIIKKLFNLRQNFDQYEFIKLKNYVIELNKTSFWYIEKVNELEALN